eukprot:gene59031-78762_t
MLGCVTLAQFEDDPQRSRLRTMISRFMPTEIVLQHNNFTPETMGVIKLLVPTALREILRGDEIVTAEEAIEMLHEGRYFCSEQASQEDTDQWPVLLKLTAEGLHTTSSNTNSGGSGGSGGISHRTSASVLEALGGIIWMLKRSLIDHEIISLG